MEDFSKQHPDAPDGWDQYSQLLQYSKLSAMGGFEQLNTNVGLQDRRLGRARWIGSAVAGVASVCIVVWIGVFGTTEFDGLTTQQIDSIVTVDKRPVVQSVKSRRRPRVPAPVGAMSIVADTSIPSIIPVKTNEGDPVAPGYFEASRQQREAAVAAITGTTPLRVPRQTQ